MPDLLFRTMLFVASLVVLLANCRHEAVVPPDQPSGPEYPSGTTPLPASPQRPGDPAAGYDYLIHGDYIRHGIPLAVFQQIFGANHPDDLDRTGDAAGIAYNFNVVGATNGVKVVSPNCLACHAEYLNGQLIVGLGDNTHDYTQNQAAQFQAADLAVNFLYGQNSPEWAAYYPASRAYQAIGPYIITATRGPNPADKIFATLSARRQADDLTWLDAPQFDVPLAVVPTDVPAWWHVKKKNALYYNGLGQGDFARLSMASGMLTMLDSAEGRETDRHFTDVLAWIRTLEAPAYPGTVDPSLAAEGQVVFGKNCSKCHGTYSAAGDSYPNLLVELGTVGTDPALAQTYQAYPEYHTWFNQSWFAREPGSARLLPQNGYVAPPLDGIWATAPYLHNGSVPTLDDLLNSPQRPVYWKRTFDNADFDPLKIGWHYTVEPGKTDNNTYDAMLPGYGNGGHTFGDVLTAAERQALLEYLKTL